MENHVIVNSSKMCPKCGSKTHIIVFELDYDDSTNLDCVTFEHYCINRTCDWDEVGAINLPKGEI